MADKNMNAKISVDFEESASRQSLNSGDSLPTLFGKIKKFFSDLKPVALSGNYNDLSNIPDIDTKLSDTSENAVQNKVIKAELDKKLEKTDLASVAISGSYNDLTDVPEIISTTAVLSASEWTDNSQTVSVDSVTADNIIIVSPAPDSQDNYTQSKIRCVSQSDKELIFSCDTTPTSDINVNIVTL